MTVEYQETRYGRPVGKPKEVPPGTKQWLNLTSFNRDIVGRYISVETPDRISVAHVMSPVAFPIIYEGDEINEQGLTSSPFVSLKDLVLWRRRHYSWKPTQ